MKAPLRHLLKRLRRWHVFAEWHSRFLLKTWDAHAYDGNFEWRDTWLLRFGWLDVGVTRAIPFAERLPEHVNCRCTLAQAIPQKPEANRKEPPMPNTL